MANINLKKIVLDDKWPGVPNLNLGIPTGGFDATAHTCATSEVYPIGTKIQPYQDFSGPTGPYTMIYLRYYELSGSNNVDDLSSGWGIFQQFCNSTCLSADGTASVFTCTNVGGIDTGYKCGTSHGTIAIACGTLSDLDTTTDGNNPGGYGWFWCGGVCPYEDITFFDGQGSHAGTEITTDGNVAAGEWIGAVIDTSQITLGYADLSLKDCGYSLETDA
jgi:hypothetical protein